MKSLSLVLIFNLITLGALAHLSEPSEESELKVIKNPPPRRAQNTIFDKTQKELTKTLLSVSDKIDSFFGDERINQEGKRSHGLLTIASTLADRQGFEHDIRFRIRLRLPRTQSRLNLVVENISAAFEKDAVENAQTQENQSENNQNDLTAALRLIISSNKFWDIHTDAGIKIKLPLNPFALIRIRRSFFPAKWEIRITENIFWFQTNGFGELTRVDFDRPLSKRLFFRFANSASYLKSEELLRINNSFSLVHMVTDIDAISYTIGMSGLNKPEIHATGYGFSIGYRRSVWRKWFFAEVSPGVSFARSNNFKSTASITVKLESHFGGLF